KKSQSSQRKASLSERFFSYYVRHVRNISAVIAFEDINQPLHATACHASIRISREPSDFYGAGEVRIQPAAIFNCWVAQGRIVRQWFFLVNIQGSARNPVFFQSLG